MSKRLLFGRWPLALLPLLLAACAPDTTPTGITLPVPGEKLAVVYTDTFTLRASTVLADSVPSSTESYFLTGRYVHARLGALTARSYGQLALTASWAPGAGAGYDSLVLTLTPDAFRYGDTTRTQYLRVHRLQSDFRPGRTYYTADALPYDPTPLGERLLRPGRLRGSQRLRLSDALGRELWTAGRAGQLTTNSELRALLPGLVLSPADTDDAALVRWAATGTLRLYYHAATAPATALAQDFPLAGGSAHFYQLQADRRGTLLAGLSSTRQAVGSAATAAETYVQAGLGLRTKVEVPYLSGLRALGGTVGINAAQLQLEVVTSTESRFLPPPALLAPRLSDPGNRSGAYLSNAGGTVIAAPYQRAISPRTGLEQGSYTVDLTSYADAVLQGRLPNQGVLIGPEKSSASEQVVLGGPGHPAHPLKLRVYYTLTKSTR